MAPVVLADVTLIIATLFAFLLTLTTGAMSVGRVQKYKPIFTTPNQATIDPKPMFDEVYVMNLRRRPDRMVAFLNHYESSDMADIPINKFNAIDGSILDIDRVPLTELARAELQQITTTGYRNKHYQLTKGAVGCYLSHVKIWSEMMRKKHDRILIFEDDAKVPPNILRDIQKNIYGKIPPDWDVVLLGYMCNSCTDKGEYKKVHRFMLTHAYLISSVAIQKILQTGTLFPITQQIDSYLSELSSILNIYTVKHNNVKQFNSRTDIQAPIHESATDRHKRMILL